MNISLNNAAKKRVLSIDWFANCGIPSSVIDEDTWTLINQRQAIESLKSIEWENFTLNARNEITGLLAANHGQYYQYWNKLSKEVTFFFDKEVLPILPKLEGFDRSPLIDCLSWDISAYLMEDGYKELLKAPFYFEKLIRIYEAGRLPCGQIDVDGKPTFLVY